MTLHVLYIAGAMKTLGVTTEHETRTKACALSLTDSGLRLCARFNIPTE